MEGPLGRDVNQGKFDPQLPSIDETPETEKIASRSRTDSTVSTLYSARSSGEGEVGGKIGQDEKLGQRYDSDELAKQVATMVKGTTHLQEAIAHLKTNDVRFTGCDKVLDNIQQKAKKILDNRSQVDEKVKTFSMKNFKKQVSSAFKKSGSFTTTSEGELKTWSNQPTEKEIKKAAKKMGTVLAAAVPREKTSFSSEIEGKESYAFTQEFGHVEPNGEGKAVWKEGTAVSADLQKKEEVGCLANPGYITCTHGGKTSIISRSSRSDSETKVAEKMIFDAMAHVNQGQGTPTKGGVVVPQRLDVSCMDLNQMKSWQTQALSKVEGNPNESERKFFYNKLEAIETLFNHQVGESFEVGGIECQIIQQDGVQYLKFQAENSDGVSKDILVPKPLVGNFVVSGQATNTSNIKDQIKTNQPLFKAMIQNMPSEHQAIQDLKALEDSEEIKVKLLEIYQSGEPAEFKADAAELYFGLTGCRLSGEGKEVAISKPHHSVLGSTMQFIAMGNLAEKYGMTISVECKSGNDRTAESAALEVARKIFTTTHDGRMPDLSNYDDFCEMQTLFQEHFLAIAKENVRVSRGTKTEGDRPVLKVNHPVFQLFATEEFATQVLKEVKIEKKEPSLQGLKKVELTAQGLSAKGAEFRQEFFKEARALANYEEGAALVDTDPESAKKLFEKGLEELGEKIPEETEPAVLGELLSSKIQSNSARI